MKAHTRFDIDDRDQPWIVAGGARYGAVARAVLNTHDEGFLVSRRLALDVAYRALSAVGKLSTEQEVTDQILEAAACAFSQSDTGGLVLSVWSRGENQLSVWSCGTNSVVAFSKDGASEVVRPQNLEMQLQAQGRPSNDPAHKLVATTLLGPRSCREDVRVARVASSTAVMILGDRRIAEALLGQRFTPTESLAFVAGWMPVSGRVDRTHVLMI